MKDILNIGKSYLGIEIDLLENYPKSKRDLNKRLSEKTEEDRKIARKFDARFFDGDRKHGYGGFEYNPRFWKPVVPTFERHWNLTSNNSILDVGCAKGFMLNDFMLAIPGIKIAGIDISSYAISKAMDSVKKYVKVANATDLPYENSTFDYVISINSIHNLPLDECAKALKEIQRVSRKGSFITVDAYRDEKEMERMFAWNLTAKTIMSIDQWKEFFTDNGYTGDYYWFIP